MNITDLVYKSGFDTINDKVYVFAGQNCITNELSTFAALVRNAAMEEAAQICESRQTPGTGSVAILNGAADAIRNLKDSA